MSAAEHSDSEGEEADEVEPTWKTYVEAVGAVVAFGNSLPNNAFREGDIDEWGRTMKNYYAKERYAALTASTREGVIYTVNSMEQVLRNTPANVPLRLVTMKTTFPLTASRAAKNGHRRELKREARAKKTAATPPRRRRPNGRFLPEDGNSVPANPQQRDPMALQQPLPTIETQPLPTIEPHPLVEPYMPVPMQQQQQRFMPFNMHAHHVPVTAPQYYLPASSAPFPHAPFTTYYHPGGYNPYPDPSGSSGVPRDMHALGKRAALHYGMRWARGAGW